MEPFRIAVSQADVEQLDANASAFVAYCGNRNLWQSRRSADTDRTGGHVAAKSLHADGPGRARTCHHYTKVRSVSVPGGQITVTTSSDEIGNVSAKWAETGGPPVTAPLRKGFKLTVLTQVIPFELNGSSSPRYLTLGYRLDIVLPAGRAV